MILSHSNNVRSRFFVNGFISFFFGLTVYFDWPLNQMMSSLLGWIGHSSQEVLEGKKPDDVS